MKIVYVCADPEVELLGHHGCSVHIREFTNALVDAGHDVLIVCNWLGEERSNWPRARVHQLSAAGINAVTRDTVIHDPVTQAGLLDRDFGSVLWNMTLQIEGAALLERERPDFIYERYALFGTGGAALARRLGVPLILELNAPLCDQQEGYDRFPLIHAARQIEPVILQAADAVVALTPWLRDWAVRQGVTRDRIHVLPDAVAHTLFGNPVSGVEIRRQHGLEGRQVVGFVGSFHKWHDISGLLDAFAELVTEDGNRRLLLVGDGHDRKKLQKRVVQLGLDDVVVFTGKVPHDQVPAHLGAMDVSVVPYGPIEDFFFSPMKLFESMSVGCPAVAADLGQISEVVRDGETGVLYPAGDNRALARAIRTLLEDPARAHNIGAAARDFALKYHTWERVTREVVAVAQGLASE